MPIHHPLLDPLNWVVLAQSHENVSNATAQKDTRLMCCALTSGYSEGVAVYLRAGIQSLREEVKGQGFTPGYLYLCICEVEDLEIAGYAISETKRILELAGYEVLMTRTNDEYISLSERTYIQGDVFISLHANMVADSIGPSVRSMIKGMEIYTSPSMKNQKLVNESSLMAKSFEKNLKMLHGINVRGVKKKNLAVLDNNSSAAILIELGFLSNEEDLAFLSDKSNYVKIATAIKNAVKHYQEQLNR